MKFNFFIRFRTFSIFHVILNHFEDFFLYYYFHLICYIRTQQKFILFSWWGALPLNPLYLMIEDSSRKRFPSTAYFAIYPTRFFGKSNTLLTTVKYKIHHNSKTKNLTKKNSGTQKSDSNIAHLLRYPKKCPKIRLKILKKFEQNH